MGRRGKTIGHARLFAVTTVAGAFSVVNNPSERKPGIGLFCGSYEEFAGEHLVFDPGVGQGEAFAQTDGGCPVEFFLNERVVAVAAVDAFGGAEIVVALQLDAGGLFGEVGELVARDELVGAGFERLVESAFGAPSL